MRKKESPIINSPEGLNIREKRNDKSRGGGKGGARLTKRISSIGQK